MLNGIFESEQSAGVIFSGIMMIRAENLTFVIREKTVIVAYSVILATFSVKSSFITEFEGVGRLMPSAF